MSCDLQTEIPPADIELAGALALAALASCSYTRSRRPVKAHCYDDKDVAGALIFTTMSPTGTLEVKTFFKQKQNKIFRSRKGQVSRLSSPHLSGLLLFPVFSASFSVHVVKK